jgi:hypothetical protein
MLKDATATACVEKYVRRAYAVRNAFKQKVAVTATGSIGANLVKNVVNASRVLNSGSRFRSRKSGWGPLIPEQDP